MAVSAILGESQAGRRAERHVDEICFQDFSGTTFSKSMLCCFELHTSSALIIDTVHS